MHVNAGPDHQHILTHVGVHSIYQWEADNWYAPEQQRIIAGVVQPRLALTYTRDTYVHTLVMLLSDFAYIDGQRQKSAEDTYNS